MDYPFEEFEKEFPDQESIDKYLIENGYNPKMVGDWGRMIVENERLKALAASRKELLRRIARLVDPITHEPGECEDCDLMREVMKVLGDD